MRRIEFLRYVKCDFGFRATWHDHRFGQELISIANAGLQILIS